MSELKKVQAKRSAWITAAAVFLVFQAVGAVANFASLLFFWIRFLLSSRADLSDFMIYFMPYFITTTLFVGIPLFALYWIYKNDASASTLGLVLIAECIVQFAYLIPFLEGMDFSSLPFPVVGLTGFYGIVLSLGTPELSQALLDVFRTAAKISDIAYFALGIGLLGIALRKVPNSTSRPLR